uniref:Uncharacterized protein n=1 Tax=Desertifilum tharense IPPAS B-1220 TaxID=1781255 RepID=A0ACD5H2G2_9CYAN
MLLDAVDPEDRATFVQTVAFSQQNLSPWRWEGRIWTPSGKMKWISGASRPEKTSEGEIFGMGLLPTLPPTNSQKPNSSNSISDRNCWYRNHR